jgi:hypothetical protein
MYFLIETLEQLKILENKNFQDVFIEVIPNNDLYHPSLQQVSLIYVRPLDYKHGFIIVVNHSEGLHLSIKQIDSFYCSLMHKFTLNKKNICYHLAPTYDYRDISDLNFNNLIEKNPILYHEDFNTKVHNDFYAKFSHLENINTIIPIVKHYEKYENLYSKVEHLIKKTSNEFKFYNNELNKAFYEIEKNGMLIDPNIIEISNPERFIKNGRIYSQYNLYNTTLRPSNAFNGLNFAAINKDNGDRAFIVPENDLLVEFDYKSFHLYIMSKLIDFKVPDDFHTYLGKQYFNKTELTPEEYKESKQKTFHILYTEEIKKYRHIEFFKLVEEYKNKLWNEYKKNGYIKGVTGMKFDKLNSPTQVLPYLFQNYETWHNVQIINKINFYLEEKKTKLILYSYDSFLFDYSKQDGEECLNNIREILEGNGFKCGVKHGENMHVLRNF